MNEARYIDIKRFAVHDGPGIRTTLFLKGCSLRCIWCHNPESRFMQPELAIHYPKCTCCGECAKACSCHKIVNGVHEFDRANCKACGKCTEACPSGALELFGKTMTADEAAAKLLEDRIFYADNGGITLSGGEPLLHCQFCAELLKKMKDEGIHCAVDTCGNVPWSAFETVLPFTDMFLYDFKCADPEKHRRLTGSGNELILENLKKLNGTGKNIEIRMIMVPEHNMSEDDLRAAGAFLAPLQNISAVRLLSYHSLARSKFQAVGHPDTMPEVSSPDVNALENAAETIRSCGLKNVVNSLK
ncbi:MAG: glycyl-radical enzyme activating protein [Lentisphaeria bacterium]|nr:glycyl-radical enzyme activating protein [Lentisphaeria bacterium]